MKWANKAWKRLFAYAVCLTVLFASAAIAEANDADSQLAKVSEPVTYSVGVEQVELSKTLAATEWENLFEITLNVRTQKTISEFLYGNTAVVIVLDTSYTMNSSYTNDSGNTNRLKSAKTAADTFAAKFLSDDYAELGKGRQFGFVTFNTNAQTVIPLMTQEELSAKGSTYVQDTIDSVVTPDDEDPARFTNIEAGLRLAHNMLERSGAMFKHIILLTDGFPTTYVDVDKDMTSITSIDGYDTYDGVRFYNRKLNKPCTYGTDYSDEGATRAQNEASSIRRDGIYLHTVGVDIGGQTIQQKLNAHADKSFSTVDCYATGEYVIGSANSAEAYRSWLASKISGVGSSSAYAGKYANCDNAAEFNAIYEELFALIRQVSTEGTEGLWVATDSMGDLIEMRGFVQQYPTATEGSNAFEWDILSTTPVVHNVGGVTYYDYEVKYYVRLENEKGGFSESAEWPTNGPTWFDYRVVETVDGKETFSEVRRAAFDVPSVEGYLSELVFTKEDGVTGLGVEGAGFTLMHDAEHCEICQNIEALTRDQGDTQIGPFYAESDADGVVTFTRLPSGHEYVLQETKAPAGYQPNDSQYELGVHYDVISENGFVWDDLINLQYNSLTVSKEVEASGGWDDPAFAPNFTVQLQKLNQSSGAYEVLDTVTLRADDTHTFTKLLAGTYRVVELDPAAAPSAGWQYKKAEIYTIGPDGVERTGNTVTLYGGDEAHARIVNYYLYTPDIVSLTAYKQWNDDHNRDGKRPQSVRFAFLVGGKLWESDAIKDVTVQESDDLYSVSFSYDQRRGEPSILEIGYTDSDGQYHAFGSFDKSGAYVPSAEKPFGSLNYTIGYTKDENGSLMAVNTHAPEVISVRVWKMWDDVSERYIQPITVRLYADGVEINSAVLDGSENWYYVFTQTASGQPLYKYHNGYPVEYTVSEDELGGCYENEIQPVPDDPYGWILVNTYHPLPVTGDDTQLWLLMALMALSFIGMTTLVLRRKASK